MKILVDINGYYNAELEFVVREYSMHGISSTGSILYSYSGIMKPVITDINQLDQVTMKNALTHQTVHGIPFGFGSITPQEAASKISYDLLFSRTIFMADEKRAESFRNYLRHFGHGIRPNFSFACLDAFGYQIDLNNIKKCKGHTGPASCAKEIALDMLKFVMETKLYNNHRLQTVHTVVDFSSFGSSFLSIKELSMIHLDYNGTPDRRTLMVIKPRSDHPLEPDEYKEYFEKHGIDWKAGNKPVSEIKQSFKRVLSHTLFVYVKDLEHMEMLCDVDESLRPKIVRLDELGYNKAEVEFMVTGCEWHKEPGAYNCAEDNAELMICWMKNTKVYDATVRKELLKRTSFSARLFAMKRMHSYYETANQPVDRLRDVSFSISSTSSAQKRPAELVMAEKRLKKDDDEVNLNKDDRYYGAHCSREFSHLPDVIIISDTDSSSSS